MQAGPSKPCGATGVFPVGPGVGSLRGDRGEPPPPGARLALSRASPSSGRCGAGGQLRRGAEGREVRRTCLPVPLWASGGRWDAAAAARSGATSGDRSPETRMALGRGRGGRGAGTSSGKRAPRSPCELAPWTQAGLSPRPFGVIQPPALGTGRVRGPWGSCVARPPPENNGVGRRET